MSETAAGLLQTGLICLALAVCYRPLGGYMARVFATEPDTLVSSGCSTGPMVVDPDADQRWPCTHARRSHSPP